MNFNIAGPFELTRRYGMITDESVADLRAEMEAWEKDLSSACGCYVFAIRAGKGYTPYYVGQACKRSILKEALNPSNREKYNKVLAKGSGRPMLFALPLCTPRWKFRKPKSTDGGRAELDFLEDWLIAAAIEKNSKLVNNKKTKFLRKIHVTGFFNAGQGEATTASRLLTKALR